MRGTQVEQARRTCSVFFSPSSNNYCPAPTKATSQTLSLVRQKGATAVKNERIQVDYKINEQDILQQFRGFFEPALKARKIFLLRSHFY